MEMSATESTSTNTNGETPWLENGCLRWTLDPSIKGLPLIEDVDKVKMSSMKKIADIVWIIVEMVRVVHERGRQYLVFAVQLFPTQAVLLARCDIPFPAPNAYPTFYPLPAHPQLMALELAAGQDASIVFLLELQGSSLHSFSMPGLHHAGVGWNPDNSVDPQFLTFGHDDDEIALAVLPHQHISHVQVHTLPKSTLQSQADELLTAPDRALLIEEMGSSSIREQVILPDYRTTIDSPPRWIVHSQLETLLICFEGSFDPPLALVSVAIRLDDSS